MTAPRKTPIEHQSMAVAKDNAASTDATGSSPRAIQSWIGQVVGGTYRITRHLGSGGSSHVFAAEHERLGKPFAVKLLRAELDANRAAVQRFRREARAMARLSSEHVVNVVDCGELDDGTPYLVMELLEGEDLRCLLEREGRLPARRAVQLIIEACRGLAVVHDAGLVHRDLKPENLFVTRRSTGQDWCKVLDFGVARMEASVSTAQGAIIGTVRYMAPEQLCDSAAVSPGTDVYALGAILYECLTGKALCDGRTVQEVMYRVMNGEPVPLDELAPTLPKSLVELVHGCLERSPSRRPPSATALALRLAAFSPEEPLDGDTLPEQVATAAVERRATSAPRMALLAGASLLFGALLGWGMRGARVGDPVEVARLSRKSPAVRSTAVASPEPLATLPIAVGSARSDLRAPETPTPSDSTAPPRELAHRGSTTSSHAAPRSPIDPAAPTQSLSRFDHTNPYGE